MGVIGWASRRVLAWILFAPLAAAWYIILLFATRSNPQPIERIALAALVLAGITDWIIVRRVKRAMKAKQQQRST